MLLGNQKYGLFLLTLTPEGEGKRWDSESPHLLTGLCASNFSYPSQPPSPLDQEKEKRTNCRYPLDSHSWQSKVAPLSYEQRASSMGPWPKAARQTIFELPKLQKYPQSLLNTHSNNYNYGVEKLKGYFYPANKIFGIRRNLRNLKETEVNL